MKFWLGIAIYLHLVFGATVIFQLPAVLFVILCVLGMGVVMIAVPGRPNDGRPEWMKRIVRRVK